MPNMQLAFFLGFMAGVDDERAETKGNPYSPTGTTFGYWEQGYQQGKRAR